MLLQPRSPKTLSSKGAAGLRPLHIHTHTHTEQVRDMPLFKKWDH